MTAPLDTFEIPGHEFITDMLRRFEGILSEIKAKRLDKERETIAERELISLFARFPLPDKNEVSDLVKNDLLIKMRYRMEFEIFRYTNISYPGKVNLRRAKKVSFGQKEIRPEFYDLLARLFYFCELVNLKPEKICDYVGLFMTHSLDVIMASSSYLFLVTYRNYLVEIHDLYHDEYPQPDQTRTGEREGELVQKYGKGTRSPWDLICYHYAKWECGGFKYDFMPELVIG